MKTVSEYLKQLGLSEIEAKLYLGLLELGSTTVMELANHVGIKRITAHFNVESLIAKGLVTESRKGARRQIVAEDPGKLENFLEDREVELHNLKQTLPTIIQSITKNMPKGKGIKEVEIKYYEGHSAVKRVYEESLDSNEVRSFVNIDKYYEVFPNTEEMFIEAMNKNEKRQVWDISIESSMAKEVAEGHSNYYVKYIPPSEFFSGFDILMFDEKVAIIQLEKDNTTATVIQSPLIYSSFMALHQTMWKLL